MEIKKLKDVTLERILNAPRELVWRAFTEEKLLKVWWGPHGFTNPVCEMDVRVGGKLKIHMDAPAFPNHWCHGVFHEIVKHEKLVFTTTAFIDESGKPKIEGRNTVTFEKLDGNKTKLTLHVHMIYLAPDMQAAYDGMETGWSQSFERLAKLLESL